MTEGTESRAIELLRAIAGPSATFRSGQLETIVALVEERAHLLLVQRTGWGKSAVYFIASRLLRDRGGGPTLLISPLLALMRNQIDMAQRAGIRAATINSSNRDDWEEVRQALLQSEVDLLLVSPERLGNADFRSGILPLLTQRSGLFVIDEAHCISDWGHDFRPDYRRLGRVVRLLPANVPVLGTTATANDRVTADVGEQLGLSLAVRRGSLDRPSLRLGTLRLPDQAERLAWLAKHVPRLPGSGIVYCLTKADTERVAAWLRRNEIDAVAYHAGLQDADRVEIERRLSEDRVKAVVGTSALGMGFDKPNLGFVLHFQAPPSAIDYYQQVGRAGRALDTAFGILLSGHEDTDIQEHFISTAFPPQETAEEVVSFLERRAVPASRNEIEAHVNVRRSRLEAMLKVLEIEGAVEKAPPGWRRTVGAWSYDADRAERVTAQRRVEQKAMSAYLDTDGCLMQFLRRQLDDHDAGVCGRCANCTGEGVDAQLPSGLVAAAVEHLRWQTLEIEPRKQWPTGSPAGSGRIVPEHRAEPGRCLSIYRDSGWGRLVKRGKSEDGWFSDDLADAVAELVSRRWRPDPPPEWVTFVPSLRRPDLVRRLAERVADRLGLPCRGLVIKTRETRPQKEMENNAQQMANVHGVFALAGDPAPGPVLIIDDIVDSRWTLTVVSALLRQSGSGPVHPLALASAGPQ